MIQLLVDPREKLWTFTKAKLLLSRPYNSGVMNLQILNFRWGGSWNKLHRDDVVGLNSWSSWKWTTWCAWWQKAKNRQKHQLKFNKCSWWMQCSSGQIFYTHVGCMVWAHSSGVPNVQCSVFPIHVKLEWFLYTVRMMVPTSNTLLCPFGSALVYLNIQFYIAMPAQTSNACDTSAWVQWKHAWKLRNLCAFAYTYSWWIWLISGILEAMQRKAKIDVRVGLARPRV